MDKWVSNNNFNKILALALGIILWTMVHIDTAPVAQTTVQVESKIIENVKIEDTGLDEDKYVLKSIDAESVSMEVQGKRSDLTYKLSDAYSVTLDLSHVQPGDTTLPLSYTLPKGVALVRMTPNEVNVHVELRNTQSFPVSVVTKGETAAGYQLGTPVIQSAATAEVTLAASELDKVAKVQGTIELDGESATFTEKKMKLYAYDSSGKEIKDAVIEPSTVGVQVPITLPLKSLPLKIGFTGQLQGGLVLSSVTPEQETVVVYGQKDTLAALNSYEATVDLGTIDTAGTTELKLNLKPPEGTEQITPGTLNVSVTTSETSERTIEGVPVKLQGLGSGLEAVVTEPGTQTVALTLSGATNLLEKLEQGQINAVADLGGLTPGTHEVTLQVKLPQFIELVSSAGHPTVRVQVQSTTPSATPAASQAPDTGSAPTPEPSSEPAAAGESSATEQPTHSPEAVELPTPAPSEIVPESTGPANGNGNSGNTGSAGNVGNVGSTGGT